MRSLAIIFLFLLSIVCYYYSRCIIYMEELFVFFYFFFPLHRVWKRGEKKEKKNSGRRSFFLLLHPMILCTGFCALLLYGEARLKNEPSCGRWFHGPDLGLFYYTLPGSADIGGLVFFLLFFCLMITADLEVFNDIHMMFNYYPRCNRYTHAQKDIVRNWTSRPFCFPSLGEKRNK